MRDTARGMSPDRSASPQRDHVRASDADRERVAEQIREHYGEGSFSEEELDQRVEAVYAARTVGELAQRTVALPGPADAAAAPQHRRRRGALETSVRIHATTFLVVNLMLVAIWAASGGGYFWP